MWQLMGAPASSQPGPLQLQLPSPKASSPASAALCLLPPLPPDAKQQAETVVKVEEAEARKANDAASPGCSGRESAERETCSVVEASAKVSAALAARTATGVLKRPATATGAAQAEPACKVVCKRPAAKEMKACFGNERSRSQIRCRGPNGSFAIKYANVQAEKRAIQTANEWVKKESRNVAEP